MSGAHRLLVAALATTLVVGASACSEKNNRSTTTVPASSSAAARAADTGVATQSAATGAATPVSTAQATSTSTSGAAATTSGNGSGASGGNAFAPATKPVVTSGSIVDVVKALTPSVVRVRTTGGRVQNPFGQVQQESGVGTGIIIDTAGHIVTNNHVVTLDTAQPAGAFTVDLWDGRSLTAKLVARDPNVDLAVLQIDAQNLTPAQFADPVSLQVGQDVVAIGYALDLGSTPSVTKGIISALHRDFTETIQSTGLNGTQITIGDVIQTDTAINEGNSGGPLVNLLGQVVGVNTGAIRPSASSISSSQVQGINYAISVQTILPVVKSLIAKGNVDRGYLGVNIAQLTRDSAQTLKLPVSDGVIVQQVVQGGPADKAGLQANDIVVKLGSEDIHTVGDLQQALIDNGPGVKLSVDYYRGSSKQNTSITLGARPAGT